MPDSGSSINPVMKTNRAVVLAPLALFLVAQLGTIQLAIQSPRRGVAQSIVTRTGPADPIINADVALTPACKNGISEL